MRACLVAAGLACGLAASPARADTASYALVIGNNAVPAGADDQGLRTLRYADDDAVRFHQLLSRVGTSELLTMVDDTTERRYPGLAAEARPPTRDNLRRAVARMAERVAARRARGDDAIVYVVFSGHGALAADGEPFLALADGPLTRRDLFDEVIAPLPATYLHLIIDACHAGGVVGVRGGFFGAEADARSRPLDDAELAGVVAGRSIERFPHVGVLLSASIGQEAHEWSEVESGVFTHEILSGLLGPADVNGDLVVEYTEIQAYVAAANRDIRDPRAVPRIVARPPRANARAPLVALTAVRQARFLTGRAGGLGRFHIELGNGQRYLDAHFADDAEVAILLPPSPHAFVRQGEREAAIPARAVVAIAALPWRAPRRAARGSIGAALRADLFASPYGESYYRGFVDSIAGVSVSFDPAVRARPLAVEPAAGPRRSLATGLLAASGIAVAGSLTFAGLAYDARRDFMGTELQRTAHDAADRYHRYRAVSVAAGVASVALAGLGWWLWPDAEPRVQLDLTASGDDVGAGASWRW
jgi:hypothetical protein